jgi:hypothetical protein
MFFQDHTLINILIIRLNVGMLRIKNFFSYPSHYEISHKDNFFLQPSALLLRFNKNYFVLLKQNLS